VPDSAIHFSDISAEAPTRDSLAAGYAALNALLDRGDAGARLEALVAWDGLRREVDTWGALVHLRFAQDTADPERRAAREYADALSPVATGHEVALKRRLLDDPDRAGLAAAVGDHALMLWAADVTTFDPAIAGDLAEESRLSARYTELLASARLEIDGQRVNLSGLAPYAESSDRDARHRAELAQWDFFAANAAELDGLYDALVRLRHGMARKLGFESYAPLGYRRLRRTDYGPDEVARYRDEVATQVVPLVSRLMEARRAMHGWERLMFWDEALVDPRGNPGPVGGHDALVAAASGMFEAMDPRLGAFFGLMRDGGFMDLRNRPAKAGGGFCTSFPSVGAPFIFANFNGTHNDIGVFTHEMGHAFQCWQSRDLPGIDLLWPTMEAAEIHSMGLEFLCHPWMGALVGEGQADRFRRMHLINALCFLPYGVLVDHFQHEVYAQPEASPAERHAIWQRLERRYLPWTDYGDLAHPAMGGRWQAKRHVYNSPFYYIDYTLAQCCALQLWTDSLDDHAGTMRRYVALCGRGGSAPFGDLVRSAGLASPFEPGVLANVVRRAETALGL